VAPHWDQRLRRHQPRPYLARLRWCRSKWGRSRSVQVCGVGRRSRVSAAALLLPISWGVPAIALSLPRVAHNLQFWWPLGQRPPTGRPEMWVWRRRDATINDVWLCLEDFQASRSSAQNAITGAGRAARSAQCQNPRRMRSAAPAICHGNSACGTSGPPSSGVRQLPPREPSPIRTGQGSAGRRFEDPRASANNMTVRLNAVPL